MALVYAGQKVRVADIGVTTARYYSTDITSTIAASANLVLKWNNLVTSSPDVTASGTGNTTFTLLRAGLWIIEACHKMHFAGTIPTTGSLYYTMARGATGIAGSGYRSPIYLSIIPNAQICMQFAANEQITVTAYNNTNQTVTLNCIEQELSHITLTRLQG